MQSDTTRTTLQTRRSGGRLGWQLGLWLAALFVLPGAAQAQTQTNGGQQQKWSHATPVEPGAGAWRALVFPEPKDYTLAAPPANDSATTRNELTELHQLAARRNAADRKEIDHWAGDMTSPNSHWFTVTEQMIGKYKLSHPAAVRVHALLSGAMHTTAVATFAVKYQHLRPRPTDLDSSLSLPSGFNVPAHPSYPSGHSALSGAARTVLASVFPNEAATFEAMAGEAGMSRLKAGIHFRSDMVDGDSFGARIAGDVLRLNAPGSGQGSLRFSEIPAAGAH